MVVVEPWEAAAVTIPPELSTGATGTPVRSLQWQLREIGFPINADGVYGPQTARTVARFQEGWAFGDDALTSDGMADPETRVAIQRSAEQGGRLSTNFWFGEFRSKGSGQIRVRRELVTALEAVRALRGSRLGIMAGYRDPPNDVETGNPFRSRHLYGEAVDIPSDFELTVDEAVDLGMFTGIGYYARTRIVRHLDVRGIPTGSLPTRRHLADPAIWEY